MDVLRRPPSPDKQEGTKAEDDATIEELHGGGVTKGKTKRSKPAQVANTL